MKFLILLCVLPLALAEQEECGENQHYNSCGTMCPLTCKNYMDPPKACILMCNPGCHCNEGYVKTEDGRCVKPESCPQTAEEQCGENQHYDSCGTMCPLTCKNYMDPPKACILMCNPGCHCNEGYVKTEDGRCVKPETCPQTAEEQCGENQHYDSCGTMCPLTCKNYMDPPKACILMCNPGCHCNEGYVKTEDGRCVKPESCPQTAMDQCGEHQYFASCGTPCELTCRNYLNPPKICPAMCKIGCYCVKGYVKTDDGRCVRPENCPEEEQCGTNQQFTTCGTACPLTCDNYSNPPKICTLQCVIGCECKKGYVKTRDGQCVRPEECPSQNGVEREACDLPAETGVCRGFFPRFYFDRTTGQCQKFVYGGCGGNENNFKSLEECQKTCGVQATREVCSLPSETGLCKAYFPRYFYNSKTGKCERFIYGGCGGNGNNFNTQAECEEVCGSS